MNIEIFDYVKALSKKEYFYINIINVFLSINIIISSFFSIRYGVSNVRYLIIFGCAAMLMALNSYKCFRRKSANGQVFLLACLFFAAITAYVLVLMIRTPA